MTDKETEEIDVNVNLDVDAPSTEDIPAEEQAELMKVWMNGAFFLLPVQEVEEILKPLKLTPVPMAPDHLMGVSNIRGQIVCIIDPGKVLHLGQKRGEQTENTRFIILRHPRMHLGIWVDEVSELYRVAKSNLPDVDPDSHDFLRGEMNIEGDIFNVLNTQMLFE